MSLDAMFRRLAKIEERRGSDRITALCNLAGHSAPLAAEAVRDWRAWVASGRARRAGSKLILTAPRLTAAEWSARHAPRIESLH